MRRAGRPASAVSKRSFEQLIADIAFEWASRGLAGGCFSALDSRADCGEQRPAIACRPRHFLAFSRCIERVLCSEEHESTASFVNAAVADTAAAGALAGEAERRHFVRYVVDTDVRI